MPPTIMVTVGSDLFDELDPPVAPVAAWVLLDPEPPQAATEIMSVTAVAATPSLRGNFTLFPPRGERVVVVTVGIAFAVSCGATSPQLLPAPSGATRGRASPGPRSALRRRARSRR